mmetsp:Transcript_50198/g.92738  ORF Transcript_50198/g.92738 Transcript_50198/m.92738 type:complete len:97 (-) Transcript_50198:262-552(-)
MDCGEQIDGPQPDEGTIGGQTETATVAVEATSGGATTLDGRMQEIQVMFQEALATLVAQREEGFDKVLTILMQVQKQQAQLESDVAALKAKTQLER